MNNRKSSVLSRPIKFSCGQVLLSDHMSVQCIVQECYTADGLIE